MSTNGVTSPHDGANATGASGVTPEELKRRRHRNERILATILVLVLGAGTFALIRKRQALDDDVRSDRRYVPVHIQFSPELTLLQEY